MIYSTIDNICKQVESMIENCQLLLLNPSAFFIVYIPSKQLYNKLNNYIKIYDDFNNDYEITSDIEDVDDWLEEDCIDNSYKLTYNNIQKRFLFDKIETNGFFDQININDIDIFLID